MIDQLMKQFLAQQQGAATKPNKYLAMFEIAFNLMSILESTEKELISTMDELSKKTSELVKLQEEFLAANSNIKTLENEISELKEQQLKEQAQGLQPTDDRQSISGEVR